MAFFSEIQVGSWASMLSNLATSTAVMDADTERLAFKFFPQKASPITAVDILLAATGDLTGVQFTIEVALDDGDKPHTSTVLGAATSAFAFTATGFTGLQALVTNTGNLTPGTPVWIVLKWATGSTSLTGANYITARGPTVTPTSALYSARGRVFNSTDWTTVAAFSSRCAFVVKHVDDTYAGMPYTALAAVPASAPDIFDTNKQAIRFVIGSKSKICGVAVALTKTGTPGDLTVKLYEGSTERATVTVPNASIVTAIAQPFYFTTPYEVAAGSTCYIVFSQAGTSGSNDYRLTVNKFSATYASAAKPASVKFFYGTGSPPATEQEGEIPMFYLLMEEPETDLACAAGGGGGSYVFIG